MAPAAYPDEYWAKKIKTYFASDWSEQPTPFAQTVSQYLKPSMTLLELGAGAGQDSIWFSPKVGKVICTDGQSTFFPEIEQRAKAKGVDNLKLQVLDLMQPLPFEDSSIDFVYAQLVLHYFDDNSMQDIVDEIKRILGKGGILAMMVNTKFDEEYDPEEANEMDMMTVKGVQKRFFDEKSLRPFLPGFETLLFDDKGVTPKDSLVDNHGLIRFIGRLP